MYFYIVCFISPIGTLTARILYLCVSLCYTVYAYISKKGRDVVSYRFLLVVNVLVPVWR